MVPPPPASLIPKAQLQTRNHSSAAHPKLTTSSDVVQLSEIPGSGTVWRECTWHHYHTQAIDGLLQVVREWNSKWLSQQGSALVEKLYEISYPTGISDAQYNYQSVTLVSLNGV